MKIKATVFDANGQESGTFWLNGGSETHDPVCCIKDCLEHLGHTYPYCTTHLREIFNVQVLPSKIHGMGLFADRDFLKGQRVVPFGGELVSRQRDLNYRYSVDGRPDCTALYAVKLPGRSGFVDALRLRHAWAVANHSGRANCKFGKEGIVCVRDVKKGAELTVNYGPQYEFCSGRVEHEIVV